MTNGEIVIKGGVGTGASLGAWYFSHVAQLNAALQTSSLVLGLIIGAVSLWKLLFKPKPETQPKP
jgi:Na+/glutamate symporter